MPNRPLEKLGEQLRFVQRSCAAFDEGAEEEAFRIAAALRIIFHNKGQSRSLLVQLGLTDGRMLSSSRGRGDYTDYLSYRIDLRSPTPVRAVPMLKDSFHPISFNQWWRHEPIFEYRDVKYSRSKIILSAANKDGGAHVDPKLELYYQVLSSGEFTLGITGNLEYEGPPPFEQAVTQWAPNAHTALIRQFGHETLASAKHYQWTRH
jgi:hypothetical protein